MENQTIDLAKAKKQEYNKRAYEKRKQDEAHKNKVKEQNSQYYKKHAEVICEKHKEERQEEKKKLIDRAWDSTQRKHAKEDIIKMNKQDKIKRLSEEKEKMRRNEPNIYTQMLEQLVLGLIDTVITNPDEECDSLYSVISEPLFLDQVAEKVVDQVAEPIAEPVAEKVAEPVAEKVAEPVVEKVVEKVAEPVVIQITEKAIQPKKNGIKINLKPKIETTKIKKIRLSYFDEELYEQVYFEEMPDDEIYCVPRDEVHAKQIAIYKKHYMLYQQSEKEKQFLTLQKEAEIENEKIANEQQQQKEKRQLKYKEKLSNEEITY